MLRPSNYNQLMEDVSGYFLVANVLSGALLRINSTMRDKIVKIFSKSVIDPDCEDKELISLLADNGFLVSQSLDELTFLRKLHEESRKGEKALGIGIAPTLNCNFACIYCYQNHLSIDMPKRVQDSIVEYVKKNLPARKILYVNWFGGEPLLRLKILEKLSNVLIGISQQSRCDYHAVITTNGYFLTKSVAEVLKHYKVKGVQVTLDGPPQIHDKRRYLRSGKGTFDKILNNIRTSARLFSEFIIRINIDKFNASTIPQLLDILEPIKNTIVLAFRPATSTETPEKPTACSLPTYEYLSLEDKLIAIAKQKRFGILIGYTIPGTSYCSAYQRNAFMVDPHGDIHLCPVCVGRRENRYGRLHMNGTIIEVGGIQSEWDEHTPLNDPECIECLALPVCMGGCLWYLKIPKTTSRRCHLRYNLIGRLGIDHTLNKSLLKMEGGEKCGRKKEKSSTERSCRSSHRDLC